MITFLLISLVGAVMIRQLSPDLRVARLWGMYLFSTVSVNFPLALSLVASNVVGQTKKTVVQALFFVGYCAGNIAGPQVFLQRESPSYTTAFSTMIACVGICTVVILSLRTLWAVENKKRNDQWGNNSEPFVNLSEQGDEDLTDKQLYKSLRYMY